MLWAVIIVFYIINLSSVLLIAIRDVQRPLRVLTWTIITLIFPIGGIILYWILSRHLTIRPEQRNLCSTGNRTRASSQTLRPLPHKLSSSSQHLALWVQKVSTVTPAQMNVALLTNGIAKYRSLLDSLYQAQNHIDIEYYIYRNDGIGQAVTKALLDRAAAGVKVRFLRDGLGSRKLPRKVLAEMTNAGIEVRTIHPFRFPWLTHMVNHRDHCKIVTIDGTTAFTGGINVGDEYTGKSMVTGPWRDTHLELRGEGIVQLQQVFENNWAIGIPFTIRVPKRSPAPTHRTSTVAVGGPPVRPHQRDGGADRSEPRGEDPAQLTGILAQSKVEVAQELTVFPKSVQQSVRAHVQTLSSGPDSETQSVRDLFFLCATEARESLDITTPYFVPDSDILTSLKTARARGVRVRLLVPEAPDHTVIGWASTTFYRDLVESDIAIYLYGNGILHAKTLVMDGETAVVGAANYDLRSFRANYEVCEVLYGHEIGQALLAQFEEDLQYARRLQLPELNTQPLWKKIRNSGARLFAPLL